MRFDDGEARFRTGANGYATLPNLLPGRYKLRVLLGPTERMDVAMTINVHWGLDQIFGIGVKPPGTSNLGGIIFDDTNRDGVRQQTEQAVAAGQKVFHDVDRDGVFDDSEPFTISDENGKYLLTNLDAGAQFVGFAPVRGWRAASPIRNQRDTLEYDKALLTRHVGVTAQPQVRGTIFNDLDQNGIFDSTERGLRGWTVFADLDNDGVFDEASDLHTATDSLGRFKLDLPVSGKYVIRVASRAGYRTSAPQTESFTTTLKAGQIRSGFVFGQTLANV